MTNVLLSSAEEQVEVYRSEELPVGHPVEPEDGNPAVVRFDQPSHLEARHAAAEVAEHERRPQLGVEARRQLGAVEAQQAGAAQDAVLGVRRVSGVVLHDDGLGVGHGQFHEVRLDDADGRAAGGQHVDAHPFFRRFPEEHDFAAVLGTQGEKVVLFAVDERVAAAVEAELLGMLHVHDLHAEVLVHPVGEGLAVAEDDAADEARVGVEVDPVHEFGALVVVFVVLAEGLEGGQCAHHPEEQPAQKGAAGWVPVVKDRIHIVSCAVKGAVCLCSDNV